MKILDALESIGLGCFMIGVIVALVLVITEPTEGSTAAELQDATEEADKPFTVEKHLNGIRIITDKETGVQYIAYKAGYGVGITIRVDETGKPIVKESNHENDE